MGRLTISLPDDLETQLDNYAKAQGKPVSQVVAEAVRTLLNGPAAAPAPTAPSAPTPSPAPAPVLMPPPAPAVPEGDQAAAAEDRVVRRYLEHLHRDLELMLETVQDINFEFTGRFGSQLPHMPPFELAEPPWLGRRGRS